VYYILYIYIIRNTYIRLSFGVVCNTSTIALLIAGVDEKETRGQEVKLAPDLVVQFRELDSNLRILLCKKLLGNLGFQD
jgi:hypothetical protein